MISSAIIQILQKHYIQSIEECSFLQLRKLLCLLELFQNYFSLQINENKKYLTLIR